MAISSFPGLGRYAALGSMLAAREGSMAAQNQPQMGPSYMNPTLSETGPAPMPQHDLATAPMQAGIAPKLPQAPGDIAAPPAPVSSMIRDVAPKATMAGQMGAANRKYRGMA